MSEVRVSNGGTPQGTLSGPNGFKLLINDLIFEMNYAKYVDDTTVLSISADPGNSDLQLSADNPVVWTEKIACALTNPKRKKCSFISAKNTTPFQYHVST